MNEKSKKEKSNLRVFLTFIAFLIICTAVGYITGKGLVKLEAQASFAQTLETIKSFFISATPAAFIISSFLGIVIPVITFAVCRSMFKQLEKDKENDDLWDNLEDRLNVPMLFSNTFLIIDMCLFFCMIHISMRQEERIGGIVVIIGYVLFALSMIVYILITKLAVDMEKKLNPEKNGNPLDFQFQKVWMKSCDEAQQLLVYKAGYKAFNTTNAVSMILFIIVFLIIELFKFDVFALIVLAVIMLVNNLSYMLTAAKLERRNMRR